MIPAAARSSPLSRAQVLEIAASLSLDCTFVETTGDLDRHTSLRVLDKTSSFFTQEVDDLVLQGKCRLAIHSAKDLPDPLPKSLHMVALTAGVDPSDSLVIRAEGLPPFPVLATSSDKRQQVLSLLYPHARFVDIRGTIGERLDQLNQKTVDGVVIAEAALIRLGLTALPRIRLPGPTTALQGQLALIAHEEDRDIAALVAPLDCRRKRLHTGLEAPLNGALHMPMIAIQPLFWSPPPSFTHLLFTSKMAVRLFFEKEKLSSSIPIITVGMGTALEVRQRAPHNPIHVAALEQAEGVLPLLQGTLFWPHAQGARSVISDFCHQKQLTLHEALLYETVTRLYSELPALESMEEIYFTSPSTVTGFLANYGAFPRHARLHAIGAVTAEAIAKFSPLSRE